MAKVNLSQFIRSDIAQMEKYIPVPSLWDICEKYNQSEKDILKLDQGENPFGYSQKVLKALSKPNLFNYYPDPEYKKLRKALAFYTGLKMENIMVGAGADELLDLLLRLILNEGDEIINCPPTFGMYPVLIKLNKGIIVSVSRNNDFSLNIPSIVKKINKKTKAVFVCSPNNPTGNTANKNEVISLLKTGKLIIVDEAYFEFCNKTVAPLVSQYKNLVVLRTFSKWAGLAGLRLGYAIMDLFLVGELLKIKLPFNVNLAAEVAGIAAIDDLAVAQKNVAKIRKERKRMYEELNKILHITVYPSEANFLFMKVKNNFSKLKNYLENRKIIVRWYNSDLTGDAIRLSIGRPEQNKKVIKAFEKFYSKKNKLDGIIFDVDGVLVDVSKSYREVIRRTASYFLNREVSMSDVDKVKNQVGMNNDWKATYKLINNPTIPYEKVKSYFQSLYLGDVNGSKLIDNEELLISKKQLLKLKEKYKKLGIVTGRPRKEAEYVIQKNKLEKIFDCIIAMEDITDDKPSPDSILAVIKKLNLGQTVYIGDSLSDVVAAKSAGIPCLYIGNQNIGTKRFQSVLQVLNYLL